MVRLITLAGVALVLTMIVSCGDSGTTTPSTASTNSSSKEAPKRQTFNVKGVIEEIQTNGRIATIKHEKIPGYMAAMTMDFETKTTNELRGLKAGDVVSFKMVVTENDGWIEDVKKLSSTPPSETPSRQSVRVSKDVDLLQVGQAVPDYHFTNELGQAVSLSQFKGQAIGLTFIFTSCPFPTFCPRMSQNFSATEKLLKGMNNAPTNWHLLTISFDPEKDTPAVLKEYAGRYGYDPARWSFLTGDIVEITALCEQMGQNFWREGGTINHNLRTVVIDPEGKLAKLLPANEWRSEDLAQEIVKAAKGTTATGK